MNINKILLPIFILFLFSSPNSYGQDKKQFDGSRWRIGICFQYSSSFKNINISYPTVGYTGVLGGYTGKGLEIFGGYKVHKYLAIEVGTGLLLNSYNRGYDQSLYITGRFNKFYIQPGVKFIYPIVDGDRIGINICLGGGLGLNGSGRLYLEEQYGNLRDVAYARYDPMVAPFVTVGTELYFGGRNLLIGFKYQNGSFNANTYYDSTDPNANVKNAPAEIKTVNAQGLSLMVGIIQEF